MSKLRCVALIPLFVAAGCGSRQSGQPAAQPGPQAVTQQPSAQVADAAAPPPNQAVPPPPVVAEEPRDKPSPTQYDRVPAAPSARDAYGREEKTRRVTLRAGTGIDVRLESTIDTKRNRAGDPFVATLYKPVIVDGEVVVPKGTRATGHLVESKPSGRFKGRAVLSLSLDSLELDGRSYPITTGRFTETSGRHRRRNLVLIGGGGGFGAALGAIAGGPAGALIGAGAGAAAGTTGAALTGKKNVHLPVETRLEFTLRSPVELR